MNRYLPLVLALFLVLCEVMYCVTTGPPSYAAVGPSAEQPEEKEYIESKLFPKKGKYVDWIEANKLSNKGVQLARSGRYKIAIPLFQQAIQRYSHDYAYYENLGAALHKSGNLERAESTTEMAAQMAPRRWGPWYNLGLILTKEHEYKRALTALKKAKSLKAPTSKTAGINQLISALEGKLKIGQASSATTAASAATTLDPPTGHPANVQQASSDESSTSIPAPGQNPGPNPDTTTDINSSSTQSASSTQSPNSGTSPNSSTISPPNSYTTAPEVSPVPTVPANNNEKGN